MEKIGKKGERRTWTREETLAFLNAYLTRKDEFNDCRKKRFALQNVLLDLESQGILSQPTTVDMLASKLKNLMRAWKESIDNNKRTGAAPCIAPFEDLMDEIFGKSPTIANSHCVNLNGTPLRFESLDSPEEEIEVLLEETPIKQPDEKKKTSPKQEYLKMKLQMKKYVIEKRNKIFKEYANKKLEKMDEAEKNKQARHQEKIQLLKDFIDLKK